MICAECGHEDTAAGESCSKCGKSPLLDGRYRLRAVLGQGAFGTTWRGERVEDGAEVCLKELIYQRLATFEPERQFQREAAVLRQLDVDGVPAYFDDFSVATGRAVSLFLVQELVDGETLAEEMDSKRYTQDEVLDILEALLQIVADLHSLSPPVIHRDIKPSNVMRGNDGKLVLIDFGAVKDVLQQTHGGGPSVAGTIGFMAPEQLQGQSGPGTDLYGVGALAVALLSRRDPANLLDEDGRLDWDAHITVKPTVRDYLAKLLHRRIESRPASATAALEALRQLRRPPAALAPAADPRPQAARQPVRSPPEAVVLASPTSGTSVTRSMWIFGGLTSLMVGLAAYAMMDSESPPPTSAPTYSVPEELLGLRLGMSLDEVKATGPELAAGVEVEPTDEEPLESDSPRWSFKTTVAGQPAQCRLAFAVDNRLSRIRCDFDSFGSIEGFDAATRNLKQQLHKRYGLPAEGICAESSEDHVALENVSEVNCQWSGKTTSLTLKGEFNDLFRGIIDTPVTGLGGEFGRTSELRLSLSTAAHDRLVSIAKRRADEARQRQVDAARSAREARGAAERQRIEEAASRGL